MADYLDRENEAEAREMFGRCIFGYGVAFAVTEEGSVVVGLDQNPFTPEEDSQDLRDGLRAMALHWLDLIEALPPLEPAQEEPLTFILV